MDQTKRKALLEQCKGIRVTDWHDAMDAIGLFDRGLMSPDIGPLWRDTESLDHCIVGFAFAVRYVPATETIIATSTEDFLRQKGEWYGSQLKWAADLQPGDLIVFDGTNTRDTGFIGSCNSLSWLAKGAVGCVTNTGARDTDELIKQRVPVYCRGVTRGTQPNRVRVDGYQVPIECGGVYVHPEDLVVADGDGVMVIPADRIDEALTVARDIQQGDQKSRARLYKELGIPHDFTLGDAAESE
jgi:4-hydroxy-4-methyl-2-oxoglutarate aldolase